MNCQSRKRADRPAICCSLRCVWVEAATMSNHHTAQFWGFERSAQKSVDGGDPCCDRSQSRQSGRKFLGRGQRAMPADVWGGRSWTIFCRGRQRVRSRLQRKWRIARSRPCQRGTELWWQWTRRFQAKRHPMSVAFSSREPLPSARYRIGGVYSG